MELLHDPSPQGTRHPNAVTLMTILFRCGYPPSVAEAAAERYVALNGFPIDEMADITRWTEQKFGRG
jgi:hypothetical protein